MSKQCWRSVLGLALCVIVAPILEGWTRYQAPTQLIIWPKVPASVTGMTLNVDVDGVAKGTISNINTQEMLSMDTLSAGIHTFQLSGMDGFFIDNNGIATKVSTSPGSCHGTFSIQAFQTYYQLMVQSVDGKTLVCAIR